MYTKEQVEKAFTIALEGQVIALDQMRSSMPTARDTQGALNNLVTFIGCGLKEDLLAGFKDVMLIALESESREKGIHAVEHREKIGNALEKLGVTQ